MSGFERLGIYAKNIPLYIVLFRIFPEESGPGHLAKRNFGLIQHSSSYDY